MEDGVIKVHKECADILADSVSSFLCDESPLNVNDQDTVLDEVKKVLKKMTMIY